MPSSKGLIWREQRLSVIIGISVVVALAGLVAAKTYTTDPIYQNIVAGAFIVGLVLIIGVYWVRNYTEVMGPTHGNWIIVGEEMEVDVFYVKGTNPRESTPLEGLCLNPNCDYEWNPRKGKITKCPNDGFPIWFIRFETEVALVEELDFPDLFPEAGPGYTAYVRHWMTWDERVGHHGNAALHGGIPYWVSNSETFIMKPLAGKWFQGPEGYKLYPTFEMLFTTGGDSGRDIEPINEAMKRWFKEQVKGQVKPKQPAPAAAPVAPSLPAPSGGS